MIIQIVERVILFTDLHDFSIGMKELGETKTAAEFIQSYYELCGDAIVAHGGMIIKYIGDAVLATFPEGGEENAVLAAIDARRGFGVLLEKYGITHRVEVEAGIGSGPVAFGEYGHSSHREIDVFSDTVNQTARIGHHIGIAVLKPVYEAVKTTFECRKLPDTTVKWLSEPLESWEIVH